MDNIRDLELTGEIDSLLGHSVAGIGDINNDTYDDVAIGAPWYPLGDAAGRVYILYGGPGMDNVPDIIIDGEYIGDQFGWSIDGGRDLNGDGYSDMIVGARYSDLAADNSGAVYVYYGGPAFDTIPDIVAASMYDDDSFGYDVALLGDWMDNGMAQAAGSAIWFDRGGSSDESYGAVFAFGLIPEIPTPNPPASLEAVAVVTPTNHKIQLTWGDNSDNEQGFELQRKEGSFYEVIADLGEKVTSYDDTNVSLGITYTYRIRAYNDQGYSTFSNESSATPNIPDPPLAPTIPTENVIAGDGYVQLSWTPGTGGDLPVVYYKIKRATSQSGPFKVVSVAFMGTNITDSNVENETTYWYYITAVDTWPHESGPSNLVSAMPNRRPPSPDNLAALPLDANTVELSWFDNTTTEEGFRITRTDGYYIDLPADTTVHLDENLDAGTQYNYQLFAFIRDNQGTPLLSLGPNPQASATTLVAPNPPSGLTAAGQTRAVQLDWLDNADNELGFKIERRITNPLGSYETVHTTGSNVVTYTDTGLIGSVEYEYRVRAYNNNGQSMPSNAVRETAVPEFIFVDDGDPSVTYSTEWIYRSEVGGRTNNTTHESNSSTAYAEFTFTGISIELIAEKQTWGGGITVFIDDVEYATVDYIAPQQQLQQRIYYKGNLPFGEHTLRIESTGSANSWIYVDELIYGIP